MSAMSGMSALAATLVLVAGAAADCVINPDSSATWPEWPPIITDTLGDLKLPTGGEDDRRITLQGDEVSADRGHGDQ